MGGEEGKYTQSDIRHDLMEVISAIKTVNSALKDQPIKENLKGLLVLCSDQMLKIVSKIDKNKN